MMNKTVEKICCFNFFLVFGKREKQGKEGEKESERERERERGEKRDTYREERDGNL
jgi:hypothetical protein